MKKRLVGPRRKPVRGRGFRRAGISELAEKLPVKKTNSNPKLRKKVYELLLHPKTRGIIEELEVGKGESLYKLPELKSARRAEELAERIRFGHDDVKEAARHIDRMRKNQRRQSLREYNKHTHIDHHVNNILMSPLGSLDMALEELEEKKGELE
jgi:hypothetical protein